MKKHPRRGSIGSIMMLAFGFLACSTMSACYTRVVDGKGLGADSPELRKAAEDDAKPRRVIRRNLFPDADD